FFVIRQKSHLNYEIVDGEDLLDDPDNVLLDQTISLTGYQSKKKYPGTLRRIVYYAPELKRAFTFLTNNFALKAGDITLLYKQRWQVELFFRWIKQHIRVTSFWGNTERCENTNLCCGYSILSGSHCRARLRTQKVHFQRPQSGKQGVDRQDSGQRSFQWP
ncbi:MAG: transposase, partial [Bacteroidales bacterium]|nr:transposase [Bacteroidales bacterium]